ncbi:DMT family transporter [Calidithermus chliarophilus]|uniref:DMT family transporter n=1 Tax=Calidithermus chliarophilus TaxID=52023 RepID=UPI0004814AB6|nr:DMT family transporter [Calidithermus chliarophilus]
MVSLLLASALLGSAFLFIKLAAPVVGPVLLMTSRVLLAALALLGLALILQQPLVFSRPLGTWLVLGALNAALPFTLVAWSELHITSSLASILIASLPLFTALVSRLGLGEKLDPRTGLGLGLGLVGVVILSGWSPLELTPKTLLAVAATLLASLCYALAAIYTKRRFQGVSRMSLTIGNFASAGVLLLPFSLFAPAPQLPPASALGVILALTLVATVVPYLLYFRLLERLPATTATSVGYLIPAFGALWGVVFLAEPINAAMLVGFGVVLLSVALVSGLRLRMPRSGLRLSRKG